MLHAWVGAIDKSGKRIIPATSYGKDISYIDGITISASADEAGESGPVGIAFHEKRHVIVNDYGSDGFLSPWRDRAMRQDIRSGAFFPVLRGGKPYAVFVVNSDQVNAFDQDIAHLLK